MQLVANLSGSDVLESITAYLSCSVLWIIICLALSTPQCHMLECWPVINNKTASDCQHQTDAHDGLVFQNLALQKLILLQKQIFNSHYAHPTQFSRLSKWLSTYSPRTHPFPTPGTPTGMNFFSVNLLAGPWRPRYGPTSPSRVDRSVSRHTPASSQNKCSVELMLWAIAVPSEILGSLKTILKVW